MNSILKATALQLQSFLTGFDNTVKSRPLMFPTSAHYPVFILGAPRSGSTLLYQLLLRSFEAGYISNLMALVPLKMVTIAKILRSYYSVASIKTSHFGYVGGLFSPSEAGAVQRFWFDNDLSPEEADWVRNTFVLLSQIISGPIITKNLFNTFRLNRIRSILPEARFIHIRRDPLFNAQSLLNARQKINGSENIWWSIKPEGYMRTLDQAPEFQVLWQIKETEKIVHDFFRIGQPDHFNIGYEDICNDAYSTLEKIGVWLETQLKKPIPVEKLMFRNKINISMEKWRKIQKIHSMMEG